ncbi:HEAT repeat domain-containing protein [Hyalangium gracile]|uniref:HEAT repeat domain-containing protein n=1 Tax=Hyalangium gracile TaxID=394092 RepID=UPI00295EDD6A|nr:HEAT repeat domain-containing protein [Hyalangium gracile]
MTPALLLLMVLSADPRGGAGTTDCWKACQRHVQEAPLRAKLCRLCIIQGGTTEWVLKLGEVKPVPQSSLRSALTDEDWRIRWAAVRASAKARGVPEPRALAEWVTETQARADLAACLTAARAAAEAGSTPSAFLQGAGDKGAAAASRVQARKDAIRTALEVELYAEDVGTRLRALSHLATFLKAPAARVVLDAMEGRPESADKAVAGALLAYAERNELSVGKMLVDAAQPPDQARVNRLFALYSEELQALQQELASSDATLRAGAVRKLRLYGPLAQRELERALQDADTHVRQAAARGLAQAEGLTLLQAAGKRLQTGAELAIQRPWLEALAHEKTCQAALLTLAEDPRQPVAVRGEALGQLSECDGNPQERAQRVAPFLKEAQPPLRAGALRALSGPWSGEVGEVLTPALGDPAPEVVVAAVDTAVFKRKTGMADDIAALLGSEHAEVRQASARALERLGKDRHVKALTEALRKDTVAAVRVSAAQALGQLGGPFAVSALSEAAAKDPDTHVQHVSREALKRLGFSNR